MDSIVGSWPWCLNRLISSSHRISCLHRDMCRNQSHPESGINGDQVVGSVGSFGSLVAASKLGRTAWWSVRRIRHAALFLFTEQLHIYISTESLSIEGQPLTFQPVPGGCVPAWWGPSEQDWTYLGCWGWGRGRVSPGEEVWTGLGSGHMEPPTRNRQTRLRILLVGGRQKVE